MSYLHDEIEDEKPLSLQDRELTLGTGTILGIFFGLALLCALFFGFGYNMGSKSRVVPVASTDTTTPGTTNFNAFKPAPGSPASQPAPAKLPETPLPATTTVATTSSEPAPIIRNPPANSTITAAVPVAPIRTPEAAESPSSHPAPSAEGGGAFVVQIAAVSHQEDADLLVNALKRKGYSVIARTEPQDKLFHIQVGPFASKKDAEAMRQRLLGDGYNAIVK